MVKLAIAIKRLSGKMVKSVNGNPGRAQEMVKRQYRKGENSHARWGGEAVNRAKLGIW